MSPAYISLAFLIVFIPLITISHLMPVLNLHLISDRDALLRQKLAQSLRLGTVTAVDLMQLKVPGVNLQSVQIASDGEYIVADLVYNYSNLLSTKYFQQATASKSKSIKVVTVRQD